MKMVEWEELGRFLVGLAGKITKNVPRGLQNVGQSLKSFQITMITKKAELRNQWKLIT